MTEEKNIEDPARNGARENEKEIKKVEKTEDVKKDIKKFFKKAEKKESKEEEYLLGWKRCMADFENYKKRQQESAKNIGGYIKEDLILQIIPVIDNFHSATEHIPQEQKVAPWVVGIMYIQKQLEDILKENGVTEMNVEIGNEFDPNLHEAVANNQETKDKKQETGGKENTNKITRVVLKGYKLGERVIRAARVIVE